MVHDLLIAVHAATGGIALLAGGALLADGGPARLAARALMPALTTCVATLAGAVAVDWTDLAGPERVTFAGLTALAILMVARGWRGTRAWASDDRNPRTIADVGFVVISLLAGFVIVLAIDLNAPTWVVAAVALATILGGRRLVHATGTRLDLSRSVAQRSGR